MLSVPVIAIGVFVALLFAGIRVLQEYERGVVFRLGRYAGVKQAGLTWIIPGVDRLVKISLREIVMDVPQQAEYFVYGVLLIGGGVLDFDNVEFMSAPPGAKTTTLYNEGAMKLKHGQTYTPLWSGASRRPISNTPRAKHPRPLSRTPCMRGRRALRARSSKTTSPRSR